MLRVASVFSGIGAPEWALKRLGNDVHHTFACDVDKFAKKSFLANYDIDPIHFHDDITKLDATPYLNQVDIFAGGSPCQSFSTFGNIKGFDDTRGTLFFHYARIIREMQPRVFLFENVANITRHDKGKTWKVIQKVFDDLGYSYKFQILNAKDYGIPQSRSRVFVVGFRSDLKEACEKFEFPTPIPLKYTAIDFLQDRGISQAAIDRKFTLNGPVDPKLTFSPKTQAWVQTTGTKGFYAEVTLNNLICKTILATCYKKHRAGVDNYYTDPITGLIRCMSPVEHLRLMGFDDDFKIVVSNTQMMKQAGNSIVVDVVEAIFKNVLAVLPEDDGKYVPIVVEHDADSAVRVTLDEETNDEDIVEESTEEFGESEVIDEIKPLEQIKIDFDTIENDDPYKGISIGNVKLPLEEHIEEGIIKLEEEGIIKLDANAINTFYLNSVNYPYKLNGFIETPFVIKDWLKEKEIELQQKLKTDLKVELQIKMSI